MWKEMAVEEFGLLSQHLSGWTGETPKPCHLGQTVSGLRFETQTRLLPLHYDIGPLHSVLIHIG